MLEYSSKHADIAVTAIGVITGLSELARTIETPRQASYDVTM